MEWHIYRGESMKELTSFLQKPDVIVCSVVLVLLLIGYRFGGMRYTSVKEIIKNYLSCFSDDNGRILFLPVVYYFGVPLLVSIVAALKHEMEYFCHGKRGRNHFPSNMIPPHTKAISK